LDWGRRDYATALLGDAFELEFAEGESPQLADSPEQVWTLFVTGFGPIKSLAASLDDERRGLLHDAFLHLFSNHTDDSGQVSFPREYIVIIGRRL
jgi:hypothetical protein